MRTSKRFSTYLLLITLIWAMVLPAATGGVIAERLRAAPAPGKSGQKSVELLSGKRSTYLSHPEDGNLLGTISAWIHYALGSNNASNPTYMQQTP